MEVARPMGIREQPRAEPPRAQRPERRDRLLVVLDVRGPGLEVGRRRRLERAGGRVRPQLPVRLGHELRERPRTRMLVLRALPEGALDRR